MRRVGRSRRRAEGRQSRRPRRRRSTRDTWTRDAECARPWRRIRKAAQPENRRRPRARGGSGRCARRLIRRGRRWVPEGTEPKHGPHRQIGARARRRRIHRGSAIHQNRRRKGWRGPREARRLDRLAGRLGIKAAARSWCRRADPHGNWGGGTHDGGGRGRRGRRGRRWRGQRVPGRAGHRGVHRQHGRGLERRGPRRARNRRFESSIDEHPIGRRKLLFCLPSKLGNIPDSRTQRSRIEDATCW